jgi:multidrug transporter EmrE-like cation transporter
MTTAPAEGRRWQSWLLLLAASAAMVAANYFLKRIGQPLTPDAATLSWATCAALAIGASFVSYSLALGGISLAIGYSAFVTLNMLGTCAIGVLLFGETLRAGGIAGVILILAGLLVLCQE